jgi:RNA polymerase sigma factor (sigma-70 family)
MSEAAVPGGIGGRIGATRLLSDDRLAQRAVAGDERAFAAIYGRYHQDLYRFCLAIAGNPADAQDALQNTMVKVLRALPGEQRRIELKPWLYRIAHNESVELVRRRRPTEELDPELIARGGGLAEDAELRERLRRLIADLEQLPERQRGALVMRELAGLDYAEIAAAFGTSPAVARQTLYEARLSLRRMDTGHEMTCAAVTRALSDADGRVTRRRDIRAHLRTCPDCRRFRAELEGRRDDLAALSPLPAVAAAGLLQGLLGGAGGSAAAGAGMAGALGGGAAKSLGASAAIKSAAAVAVVAAVGAGAADRGGIVDVTPWGAGGSQQTQSDRGAGAPGVVSRQAPADSGAGGRKAAGGEKVPSGENGSPAVQPASAVDAVARARVTSDEETAPGSPAAANGAVPPAAADPGSVESNPSGRGHEKQHPTAAGHGQQTAAGHKAAGKGGGHGGGRSAQAHPTHPFKPSKPSKPADPVKPAQSKPPNADKGNSSSKAPADSGSNAQPPGSAPQATVPVEPPPHPGKQP